MKTKKSKAGRPAKKPRGALQAIAAAPNLRRVYRERHALQRRVDQERKQRYREFLVRVARTRRGPAAAARPPVMILAEGDSWFEYPVPLAGGSAVDHLEGLVGERALVCNLAHHGDEVRQMLGLAQRRELETRLRDPAVRFDALLFSGGGNDLVGDQFCLWLKPMFAGATAGQLLDFARVDTVLDLIVDGYHDLITIRDKLSPNTKIFVNGYDFPQPSNQGVCGAGPWLKPSLDYRGITDPALQAEIAQLLLARFAARLQNLQAATRDFTLVDTQRTLNPKTDWGNEIHPNRRGFAKIAGKFHAALKTYWPQL